MRIEPLTDAQRFFNAGLVDKRMLTTALDNAIKHLDLNIKVMGENFLNHLLFIIVMRQ